jgi:tripartite-type tricarboxylate transporter receptor subunit TctC
MSRLRSPFKVSFLALLAALTPPVAQAADAVADFYKGKTVTLIIGHPPGDGFDLYGRLIARHLPKHIPGAPSILVQNMVGAGSLVSANYVNEVPAQDGTFIALIGAAIPFSPLLGVKEAKFDPVKLHWLPSPNSEVSGVTLWHTSPTNSIDDARKRETFLASASGTSTSGFYGRLINDVLGTKFKLIQGYNGMSPAFLAMERGEVEGHPSVPYGTLKASKPDWIKDKKVKVIVQFGRAPHPDQPSVPFLTNEAKSDNDKLLVDMAIAPLTIGRPFFMAGGVPADRVAALRKAFVDTYRDPQLLSEAEQARLEFAKDPMTGEEIQALIARTYGAPAAVVNRLRAIYDVQQ